MLKDKVALITGASKGIGRAIATRLAEEGVRLGLAARNERELRETDQLCQANGAQTTLYAGDLCEALHLPNLIDHVIREFRGLDYLINNAGVYYRDSIVEANTEEWDRMFDLNVRALMRLTKLAIPHIEKQGAGAIINIASMAGINGFANTSAYCATKHAVMGFTESLFAEVRESNIKVCAICPGYVNTPMISSRPIDLDKAIPPEGIAHTVLYILKFPQAGCPIEIRIRPQRSP